MIHLEILTESEKEMLLKYPAYISLLAANYEVGLDKAERKKAIETSHIKTYSSDPILKEFYQEADKVFEKNINELDKNLPKEKKDREDAIKYELSRLEEILGKLGKFYAQKMHHSMKTFKDHVSKAHQNALEYFIFPIPIKGIND